MNSEPIMEFTSQEEAEKCLREWQDRLFLNDWIIKLNINVPRVNMGEKAGINNFSFVNKSACISIAALDDDVKSRIAKACHEQTLIHELLHCKYNILENDGSYEGKFLDGTQHQLLEQMAKSLLMAKYGLKWFRNFEVGKND